MNNLKCNDCRHFILRYCEVLKTMFKSDYQANRTSKVCKKFKSDISFNYTKIKDIKSFYRQKINELVDEIIKLSDNIEAKYDTPEMEEWKAFKRFRNTLRDNFKK